jgi:hypothetical protein
MTTDSFLDDEMSEAESEIGIWNLFSQILMPLIILITFIAVVNIQIVNSYLRTEKNVSNAMRADLRRVLSGDSQAFKAERDQAFALNQWLMLIQVLDEIMRDKRRALGIEGFSAAAIKLDGTTIADPSYKAALQQVRAFLEAGERQKIDTVTQIYSEALGRTKLTDPQPDELEGVVAQALAGMEDSKARDAAKDASAAAKADATTQKNFDADGASRQSIVILSVRAEVIGRIVRELERLHDAAADTQVAVLARISVAVAANPGQLDAEQHARVRRMIDRTLSDAARADAWRNFHRELFARQRRQLDEGGYVLLARTWRLANED